MTENQYLKEVKGKKNRSIQKSLFWSEGFSLLLWYTKLQMMRKPHTWTSQILRLKGEP